MIKKNQGSGMAPRKSDAMPGDLLPSSSEKKKRRKEGRKKTEKLERKKEEKERERSGKLEQRPYHRRSPRE
jgi:hypothetical protein